MRWEAAAGGALALGIAAGVLMAKREGVLGPKGCFLPGFLQDKEKAEAEIAACEVRRREMNLQGVATGVTVGVVALLALRSIS